MNLFQIIFLGFQNVEKIKEKIETAPDEGYEIGVVIGTYLPFALFVVFAYIVYFKARNRKD